MLLSMSSRTQRLDWASDLWSKLSWIELGAKILGLKDRYMSVMKSIVGSSLYVHSLE
jgi:hypothetical protein